MLTQFLLCPEFAFCSVHLAEEISLLTISHHSANQILQSVDEMCVWIKSLVLWVVCGESHVHIFGTSNHNIDSMQHTCMWHSIILLLRTNKRCFVRSMQVDHQSVEHDSGWLNRFQVGAQYLGKIERNKL